MKGSIRAAGVVKNHRLVKRLECLFFTPQRNPQTVFLLQNPIEPFGTGVLVAEKLLLSAYSQSPCSSRSLPASRARSNWYAGAAAAACASMRTTATTLSARPPVIFQPLKEILHNIIAAICFFQGGMP
jgi:hypothetical protein